MAEAPAPAPAPAPAAAGEAPAPAPAPITARRVFDMSMFKRQSMSKTELRRPRGQPPKGTIWDMYEGYVADPAQKPSEDHVRSEDKKTWILPEGVVPTAPPPPAKARRQRRNFQESWKDVLPYVKFVKGMGIKMDAADQTKLAMGTWVCPDIADQRVRSRSNMGRLQQVTATKHLYCVSRLICSLPE